jgi:hypothetical protein
MTSSTKLNKLISIGAALLLAAGGSLVATDVAHATASSNITSLSVNRLNSATRGTSSTYVVNAGSSDRISSFVFDENFGGLTGGGALSVAFTLPTGVTASYNNGLSVTPTTTGSSYQSNGSSVSPYTTYTATLAADGNRTAVNLRTNMQLSGLNTGQSLTVSVVVTLGGIAVTPLSSPTGISAGFGSSDTIRGTGGVVFVSGDTYTVAAGDFGAAPQSNYSSNCVWPGSSTVTAGQVYQTVWSNGSGPAITSSYASSSYYTTSSQNVFGSYSAGSTSFTVPNPAPEVLTIMPSAVIANLQAGDVLSPTLKVVKQGTSTDLLEPCVRNEALPAPTATANPSASSVTVSLAVPTSSSHFAGWGMVQVFACITSITDCGARTTLGRIDASFSSMGSLTASSTSVTFDAQHAISYTFTPGQTMPRWDPAVEYKYVALYMPSQGTNYQGVTASSAAISVSVPTSNSTPAPSSSPSAPSSNSNAPTWQAPIVNQVPNLSKALTTAGGQISLKDDSFTGLKSVTVGGKPVTITVGANGSVTIPVPAGQTGSADLTLTFDTGTITIIDGIKYVAPIDVAAVPVRDIAVAAGTTKVTEALVDQVRQAALSNMTNTAVQCVAYATSGSASAMAAAKTVATKVCGLAVKANPTLQVTSVSVVVNKAKARKTAVGIKVYKQN